jgi:hypothetical protein
LPPKAGIQVSNDAATPALGFLAAVALALIALLFIEMPGSPVMVTSTRTAAPAPPPNMTSQDVLAAQPKSAPDLRAEAPPKIASGGTSATNRPLCSIDFL